VVLPVVARHQWLLGRERRALGAGDVESAARSARAMSGTSPTEERVASSITRSASIRIGSTAPTQRGATTRRARRAIRLGLEAPPHRVGVELGAHLR
jgi:hypothetical protein